MVDLELSLYIKNGRVRSVNGLYSLLSIAVSKDSKKNMSPKCYANNEVVLRREAHVIDRTPSLDKRTVESSSADPSCRPYPETVFTVGKVVINLVTMHDFQNINQENINDHLW